MSRPIWIDLESVDGVGSATAIAERAQRGTHVVLRLPASLDSREKAKLIVGLAASLPDHSVFDSGGDRTSTWVTVMPVVGRNEVAERRIDVLRAIGDYRQKCESLVEGYRNGSLSAEWTAREHGGECRFVNARTGQVVEAPFEEWAERDHVNPYFFANFVKTTPGHERVAGLIKEDFHDAARILDVVETARASEA